MSKHLRDRLDVVVQLAVDVPFVDGFVFDEIPIRHRLLRPEDLVVIDVELRG